MLFRSEKSHPLFRSLQRIGVTGILQGIGKNEGWANQTWFRINDPLYYSELEGLRDVYPNVSLPSGEKPLTIAEAIELINDIFGNQTDISKDVAQWAKGNLQDYGFEPFDMNRTIKRGEMALLLDRTLDPFSKKEIDIHGSFMN